MTIEESMHVKFEKSNTLTKNVVEIDFLGEDIEKISLKDLPMQEEDKLKDDEHGEVQEAKVEPAQLLQGLEICYKPSQGAHHRCYIQGLNYSLQTS